MPKQDSATKPHAGSSPSDGSAASQISDQIGANRVSDTQQWVPEAATNSELHHEEPIQQLGGLDPLPGQHRDSAPLLEPGPPDERSEQHEQQEVHPLGALQPLSFAPLESRKNA